MKKIVYVVGGLYSYTGMNSILSRKINWLADNGDYKLYMILTERAGAPWVFDINPNVEWVNFDINFDELDTMPLLKKVVLYFKKQHRYKKAFTDYLMSIKPDICISTIRREINFINKINDGSRKIGEIHFSRDFYRKFNKDYLPSSLNALISKIWMGALIKQINKLDCFVVLTSEDSINWPEIRKKIVIPNFVPKYDGTLSSLNSKNVIAVGRYSWEKGFDLLIDAWAKVYTKHPDWKLNIYGTGNSSPFEKIIKNKRLEKVVTCNPACKDIYRKYKESSIFVLSSRHEGFGLVLLEAMSVGLPPVSFDCPYGPKSIISNGKDGLLVTKENTIELAKQICYLIENPEKREQISEFAVRKAQSYTPDRIMNKWINLFQNITK